MSPCARWSRVGHLEVAAVARGIGNWQHMSMWISNQWAKRREDAFSNGHISVRYTTQYLQYLTMKYSMVHLYDIMTAIYHYNDCNLQYIYIYIYFHIHTFVLISVNIVHEVVRQSMLCHFYKWALYSLEVQLK